MHQITLDASGWRDRADGFGAILAALGAPDWHGANLDALLDSLRGGVNGVGPPFALTLTGLPAPLAGFGVALSEVFAQAISDGITVSLRLRP